MKYVPQKQFITRDNILELLSPDELANATSAETNDRLEDGEEYLEFERLDRGVRRAGDLMTPMGGRVLPRKSVKLGTWLKIVEQLATLRRARQN